MYALDLFAIQRVIDLSAPPPTFDSLLQATDYFKLIHKVRTRILSPKVNFESLLV
jgi:hypothetical protein